MVEGDSSCFVFTWQGYENILRKVDEYMLFVTGSLAIATIVIIDNSNIHTILFLLFIRCI